MATERSYICTRCHERWYPPGLFDALLELSTKSSPTCKACQGPSELRLGFTFGLGAGNWKYKALDAFLPDEPPSWRDQEGNKVTFYPFLVAMECIDEGASRAISFWLPYWHVVETKANGKHKKKYGQWAPLMDADLFKSLIGKARACGKWGLNDRH